MPYQVQNNTKQTAGQALITLNYSSQHHTQNYTGTEAKERNARDGSARGLRLIDPNALTGVLLPNTMIP
jgi:hypothetical protein